MTRELAETLQRAGYRELFGAPGAADRTARLWHTEGNPQRLVGIAADPHVPWPARMLAAELVYDNQVFLFTQQIEAGLAGVYATALVANYTGWMADWGFVRDMADLGRLGVRFVGFGASALPALRPLLDDPREVPFHYPTEFPSQIRTGIRIQDLAALYVARILDAPVHLTEDPDQRDEVIAELTAQLPPAADG